MLSEEAIKEYQEIFQKEFGKDISREEALDQGTRFMDLMRAVYRPISEE